MTMMMPRLVVVFFALSLALAQAQEQDEQDDPTTVVIGLNAMLNDMSRYYDNDFYPRSQSTAVLECFDTTGSVLGNGELMGGAYDKYRFKAAHNVWWQKFYDSQTEYEEFRQWRQARGEQMPVPLIYFGLEGTRQYPIYQPCNYTSNTVYYRSVARICDYPDYTPNLSAEWKSLMVQNLAQLAIGSSWFHGQAETDGDSLGAYIDKTYTATTLLSNYQLLTSKLTQTQPDAANNNLVLALSDEFEPLSMLQVVPNITTIPIRQQSQSQNTTNENSPIKIMTSWREETMSIPFQRDFEFIMVAYSTLICAATSPSYTTCRNWANWINSLGLNPNINEDNGGDDNDDGDGGDGDEGGDGEGGDSENPTTLVEEHASPELLEQFLNAMEQQRELEGWPIRPWIGLPLLVRGTSVLASFGWSAQFQGQIYRDIPGMQETMDFVNIFNNQMGTIWTPIIEVILRRVSGYDVTDPTLLRNEATMTNARDQIQDQYPGASQCNIETPHALWHQTIADTLVELFIFSDEFATALQDHAERRRQRHVRQLRR